MDVVHDVWMDMHRFVRFVILRMHAFTGFFVFVNTFCKRIVSSIQKCVAVYIYQLYAAFTSSCHTEWTGALAIDKHAREKLDSWHFWRKLFVT